MTTRRGFFAGVVGAVTGAAVARRDKIVMTKEQFEDIRIEASMDGDYFRPVRFVNGKRFSGMSL
jgi:hypothetical protein